MMRCAATLAFLILIAVAAVAQAPRKRVLLEEFSTTSCGQCPEGNVIAERIVRDHPSVIWVTHHAGNDTDSLTIPASVTIASAFTLSAPTAAIDRGVYNIPGLSKPPYIVTQRQNWDSLCALHLGDEAIVALDVVPAVDAARRLLDCRVDARFSAAPAPGDLRVNLWLVEDTVVGFGRGFDQTNYFNATPGHPCFGLGDPIIGYPHRRVLRAAPAGAWGLAGVLPFSPVPGAVYSHTFTSIALPERWNARHLNLVAFVGYYHTDVQQRRVLNAQEAPMPSGTSDAAGPPITTRLSLETWPVPADAVLSLRLDPAPRVSGMVVLTDITGRVVERRAVLPQEGALRMTTAQLPAGMYLLHLILRGADQHRLVPVLHR
jgi:hypothetical protein